MPPEDTESIVAEPVSSTPDATEITAPAADTSGSSQNEGPKTLLDAISAAVPGSEQKPVEPVVDNPDEDKPKEESHAAADTAAEEDITKMPEGLSPKAKERFEKLAHMNRDLTARVEEITSAVEPFRAALQENGVRKEQFEQAASVIGMMNKGDFEGALKVLDEQRQMISLAMGKPLPGVDALAEFPDLRESVDTMQITEEMALETARSRKRDLLQKQQRETQQQEQNNQRQSQELVQSSLKSIDDFTKKMMASDIDYASIEAKLLPRINDLIQGVHPSQWLRTVQNAYQLIKDAGAVDRKKTLDVPTLRPTGNPSPASAPKTMFDAMFGSQ